MKEQDGKKTHKYSELCDQFQKSVHSNVRESARKREILLAESYIEWLKKGYDAKDLVIYMWPAKTEWPDMKNGSIITFSQKYMLSLKDDPPDEFLDAHWE